MLNLKEKNELYKKLKGIKDMEGSEPHEGLKEEDMEIKVGKPEDRKMMARSQSLGELKKMAIQAMGDHISSPKADACELGEEMDEGEMPKGIAIIEKEATISVPKDKKAMLAMLLEEKKKLEEKIAKLSGKEESDSEEEIEDEHLFE